MIPISNEIFVIRESELYIIKNNPSIAAPKLLKNKLFPDDRKYIYNIIIIIKYIYNIIIIIK